MSWLDAFFEPSTATFTAYGVTPVARPLPYTLNGATPSRVLAAYTPNSQSSAYTGQDNAQGGTVYAKLTDLNLLRVAYQTLKASHDSLLAVTAQLQTDLAGQGLSQ